MDKEFKTEMRLILFRYGVPQPKIDQAVEDICEQAEDWRKRRNLSSLKRKAIEAELACLQGGGKRMGRAK